MSNNVFEQFEDLYSKWSVLSNIDKRMRLTQSWNQVSGVYNILYQTYLNRGYLTTDEAYYANQLQQMLLWLQAQTVQVDQALVGEMIKHLVKMNAR